MISANAVLPMCLIMALGYGTRRLGWIRREEISAINSSLNPSKKKKEKSILEFGRK